MASVATSAYGKPFSQTPKKRSFSNSGNAPSPKAKRINLPAKFSMASKTGGSSHKNGNNSFVKTTKPVTGLEGLHLDVSFVKATPQTLSTESKEEDVQPEEDTTYPNVLIKRRAMADTISPGWKGRNQDAQLGFQNFTIALCYRHSLFQAFVHTPKFMNWLGKYHSRENCVSEDPSECVSCHIRDLCTLYWENKSGRKQKVDKLLRSIDLIFKIHGWSPDRANSHADPDEQLGWILDCMRTEMTRETFEHFDAVHNLLLESSITCERCGHVSKTNQINERCLSIPIKPRIPGSHLQQYINAYMDEVVHDYRCEKCSHKSDKHRIQKIAYAPDVLMIQLKRFDALGRKDSARVASSSHLSLQPFVSDKAKAQGPLDYQLTSVISHTGSTGFGHYVCDARGPSGAWVNFDDDHTSRADIKSVLAGNSNSDFTPYLFFYERQKGSKL